MVVADDAYLAEDAAELVEVDWTRGRPWRASKPPAPPGAARCAGLHDPATAWSTS